jgi:Coenzyme PQQ synthesis protein D (PqqD)
MMELISVSYQKPCWRKVKNLRVRPLHEMETCIVFTPDNPNLYSLNSTAWLIFELCDGRSWQRLKKAYYQAVEPLRSQQEARTELIAILSDLERKGIVECKGVM